MPACGPAATGDAPALKHLSSWLARFIGVALTNLSPYFDPTTETLERGRLRDLQLDRFEELLAEVVPRNRFYTEKFGGNVRVRSWDDFVRARVVALRGALETVLPHP